MKLELEKEAKNESILRKHQDVSLQNKAYKKARGKIFDLMITRP